ncbi:hypothetical protein SAMN04487861_11628 [Selenomonas ruminantium]|uniref:Uncharacterized protein n=1 Tax=Selenomonas ruminantium TaxID=971 RepID=A0A1I3FMY3_SELRU|nr:hypothetical protein [Selenomonas ruminantium]SFI12625.1 hypothetical protein SAMN04487861_11628 [Selenomonas ruminantium]
MGNSWQYYKYVFLATSKPHEPINIEMTKMEQMFDDKLYFVDGERNINHAT